jgi:hypothetical protein
MSNPGFAACRFCARQLPDGASDQDLCAACKKEPGAPPQFVTCTNCGFQLRIGAGYLAKHADECVGSHVRNEYAGVIFVEHTLRAAASRRCFSNYKKRKGGYSIEVARTTGYIPPTSPSYD